MSYQNLPSYTDQFQAIILDLQSKLDRLPEQYREPFRADLQMLRAIQSDHQSLEVERQRYKELLETILNSSPYGIAILAGSDYTFRYTNPAFRSLSQKDLTGQPFSSAWQTAEGYAQGRQVMERVIQTGEPISVPQMEIELPDGTQHIFSVSVVRITWESHPAGLVMIWDITELVRSKTAAQQRAVELEAVVRSLDAGVVIADPAGAILSMNPAALQMHGFASPADIHTQYDQFAHGFEMFYPDGSVLPPEERPARRALRGDFFKNLEIQVHDQRTGREWIGNWSASPVRNSQGLVELLVFTIKDITSQKRAEEVLRESERREQAKAHELAAILDAVPAYIWITHDRDSRHMTGNRATNELLHARSGDNISKSAPEPEFPRQYKAMRDGQEIPPAELPVQIAAAKCMYVQDYEFDLLFEDGTNRRLMGNASPLCDGNGNPAGAVGAFIDITELRRIEKETSERNALMEVQRRLLEHREMERMQIARDLHDGPIQSLSGLNYSLHFIQSMVESPEIQEMLDQVKQDIRNLTSELRNVCNELRPTLLEKFGFRKAIQAHGDDFQEKHPEIRLHLNLTGNLVEAPENITLALYRIYQEALNNALHHANATEISIHLAFDPQRILFEIVDNGKGFSGKMDWVELARQGHFGMVGMKERAEAIGGEFKAQSSPGEGTIIRVTVPITSE